MHVLCLDGGGVRGAFGAAFLAHVETHLGAGLIVKQFGLVCGTSTGAILALGLAAGLSAREVRDAYLEAGPEVFRRPAKLPARMWGPGHSNEALKRWLRQFLGERTLGDAIVPVAIPTYDAATATPRVWKSNHHRDLHSGGSQLMWEVAMASAAAPTYLPATSVGGSGAYLDGGLWANNPAMVGLIEAQRFFGKDAREVTLLSIGTGRRKRWWDLDEIASRGIVGWGASMLDVVLDAQSAAVHQQVRLLLGEQRYLRVDVELPEDIPLDDARKMKKLAHLGTVAGENQLSTVRGFFGLSGGRQRI